MFSVNPMYSSSMPYRSDWRRAYYENPYDSGKENQRARRKGVKRQLDYQRQRKYGFGRDFRSGFGLGSHYYNPGQTYGGFDRNYQGFAIPRRHTPYWSPHSRHGTFFSPSGSSFNRRYPFQPHYANSLYSAYSPLSRSMYGGGMYSQFPHALNRGTMPRSYLYNCRNPYRPSSFSAYQQDDFDDLDEEGNDLEENYWTDDDEGDWYSQRLNRQRRGYSNYFDHDGEEDFLDDNSTSPYGMSSYRPTDTYRRHTTFSSCR